MVLGLDIDGVFSDFNESFIKLVVMVVGKDLFPPRPFDIPTWHYPQHFGYTDAELKPVWDHIKKSTIFWACLDPYPDTIVTLDKLWRMHVPTYFITDRPGPNPKAQTERWLDALGFVRPTVLISGKKGACCDALKITHYIDDKIENCLDVRGVSPTTKVYMLERPWNEQLEGIPRIPNFAVFLEELKHAS